jgi:hypothetical protein
MSDAALWTDLKINSRHQAIQVAPIDLLMLFRLIEHVQYFLACCGFRPMIAAA